MSATLINLIIQIVAGALGGNAAGAASKDMSLGTAGNTIAGAIGGGVGGQILTALLPILSNAAGSVDDFARRRRNDRGRCAVGAGLPSRERVVRRSRSLGS